MPYKLKRSAPGRLLGDIYDYEDIHGARLFEQRLFESVQQNSKVQQVRFRPHCFFFEMYENIEQWSIINYNAPETMRECTELLKSLSGINFINLVTLCLEQVGIHSLQPISWVNAPNLKKINLNANAMHIYKPLAKTNFKSLQVLQLEQNPVTNSRKITEVIHIARMNLLSLKRIVLGHPKTSYFDKSLQQCQSFHKYSQLAYENWNQLFCIIKVQATSFNKYKWKADKFEEDSNIQVIA